MKECPISHPRNHPVGYKITGKLIKELPLKGKYMILYIFNAIIRHGHFPSKWKEARIIIIPKPGKDATRIDSYRPISLLSILSNLFEKMRLEDIYKSLDSDVLPAHQFGFTAKYGAIEQIHRIFNVVKTAIDSKIYLWAFLRRVAGI